MWLWWPWSCPFSHGSRECEVILVWQSERPPVITLELSNGGQKKGSCVCHLWKRQDSRRASFLSRIIQQDWEWGGSQGWNIDSASQNGRGQLGRRECGLLQTAVLLSHIFLTLEMHSQAFHCTKAILVKMHWKYNGINWRNATFLLVALLGLRVY